MVDDAMGRFVDRFGALMREAGVPPMAARIFAYVLGADQERVSARELADGLGASAAAVSGGVNYLVGVGMLERVHGSHGDRQHYYRLFPGDLWTIILQRRLPLVARWYDSMQVGIEELGRERRPGSPLHESELYFRFMTEETPGMLERWRAYREAHLGERDEPDAGAR